MLGQIDDFIHTKSNQSSTFINDFPAILPKFYFVFHPIQPGHIKFVFPVLATVIFSLNVMTIPISNKFSLND